MKPVSQLVHIIASPCMLCMFAGDDGDCMYIILRGSCNVHVDPDFDETAQAGALQKASLAPKVPKKKQPTSSSSVVKHLLRPSASNLTPLDRLSSSASIRSDVSATSRRSMDGHEPHPRRASGLIPGPVGEPMLLHCACNVHALWCNVMALSAISIVSMTFDLLEI